MSNAIDFLPDMDPFPALFSLALQHSLSIACLLSL